MELIANLTLSLVGMSLSVPFLELVGTLNELTAGAGPGPESGLAASAGACARQRLAILLGQRQTGAFKLLIWLLLLFRFLLNSTIVVNEAAIVLEPVFCSLCLLLL